MTGGAITSEAYYDVIQRLTRMEANGTNRDGAIADLKQGQAELREDVHAIKEDLAKLLSAWDRAQGGMMLGKRVVAWAWVPFAAAVTWWWTQIRDHIKWL